MKEEDSTTLFKASYGLYLLSAKNDMQDNACIINTFMQITGGVPAGCLISVNKQNFTHEMIANTRKFNLSVLNVETPFALFKRFGFQSGREVDKFKDFTNFARSENGLSYLTQYANAYMSFNVLDMIDFGTHTLFTATLDECKNLNQKESMTYNYYHQNVKPKPNTAKSKGYLCSICEYVYESEPLPLYFICPTCKHGAEYFTKI